MKNIVKINQVIGIEAIFLPDEKIIFNCIHLSIRKNVVIVEKKIAGIESFDALQAELNRDIPVSLCLSGKGILHRKVNGIINEPKKAVQSLLPNAKIEDFYFQLYPVSQHTFISVIRKSAAEAILATFRKINFAVISVSMGGFATEKIINVLELSSGWLHLGAHHLEVNTHQIADYIYEQKDEPAQQIKVASELIEDTLVVPYATALRTLISQDTVQLDIESVRESKNETLSKQFFQIFSVGVLAFFLGVLLINFLLFTHLQSRNEQLSVNQLKYSGFRSEVDSLNKKLIEKETFLVNAGWMEDAQLSYFADRLAETIPSSITLKELNVNPVDDQKTRAEKKLVFISGKINILGFCNKPTDLNPWITKIREMRWVNSVEMQNYAFDNREGKGNFYITIMVRP